MASPARSAIKRLSLLVAVALSMRCDVKTSGLPRTLNQVGSGGQSGSAGMSADGAVTATGGKGAEANPDAWTGSAASDGAGTVAAAGGEPALDSGTTMGTGGRQETGGTTGLGGSFDANSPAVDSAAVDVPEEFDSRPGDNLDVGADHRPALDLAGEIARDVPGPSYDMADGPSKDMVEVRGDMAAESTIDTRPPLTLVWSDEFEGAANTGVDTSKWSYVTWAAGQVNNEKQRYTASLQNVHLDGDGHVVIRGPKSGPEYTSGRIDTNGANASFSFKTGRIEVRAKLPAGIGSFPGIVMMGISGGWPQNGEIALMEQYGQDKSYFYASAYADGSPNSGDDRKVQYNFLDAATASTDFHIYSADWYSDHLVIQVDGQEVMRTSFGTSSPFYTTPEYIILDVAIGGDMGGAIAQDGFPMDMVVDYVRVYSF